MFFENGSMPRLVEMDSTLKNKILFKFACPFFLSIRYVPCGHTTSLSFSSKVLQIVAFYSPIACFLSLRQIKRPKRSIFAHSHQVQRFKVWKIFGNSNVSIAVDLFNTLCSENWKRLRCGTWKRKSRTIHNPSRPTRSFVRVGRCFAFAFLPPATRSVMRFRYLKLSCFFRAPVTCQKSHGISISFDIHGTRPPLFRVRNALFLFALHFSFFSNGLIFRSTNKTGLGLFQDL